MKNIRNLINNNSLLVLIIILAGILRFTFLGKFPVSLNWDEVSHGYNAYSILKTGKDEWGKLLPLANFRAYGDYPLPLNLYLTIPSIVVFGLNEFGIRFPHALLGVGTVLGTYFFTVGLTKKKKYGFLTSLLVAVDPWTLFTSRFVLQSNLAIFFLTTAAALFVQRSKNRIFLLLAALSFGLTLFSYHTTRIFSPLLLFLVIFTYRQEILSQLKTKARGILPMIVLLALFFIPLPFILFSPTARARSNMVFLIDEGAVAKIIENRQQSKLPSEVSKLIYNRPVYFLKEFGKNYLDYFSPQFLFLTGGTQYQFSLPGHGLLYLINLPFFYFGLVILFKKARINKDYRLVLIWLLLAPIPASITQERYAVLRSSALLPLPEILSAFGFFGIVDFLVKRNNLKVKLFTATYLGILLISLGLYSAKYITSYANDYSWSWQYGYKELTTYLKENYQNYDKIIITKKYGEPHEFILFHWRWDPSSYQNDPNLNRFFQSNWYWVDGFDKFYFVNDWDIDPKVEQKFVTESKVEVNCEHLRCLLIASPGSDIEGSWIDIKTINFLDGKAAFEILKNYKYD